MGSLNTKAEEELAVLVTGFGVTSSPSHPSYPYGHAIHTNFSGGFPAS